MNRSDDLLTVRCLDCATRFDLRQWRRLPCSKGWQQSPDIDDRIHRINADDEYRYRVWRRKNKPGRPRKSSILADHDEHARAS